MTNVVFKSTSTLMNKITKVTRRNLENLGQTKFAFNANPDLRRITPHFIQKNWSVDTSSREHYADHQGTSKSHTWHC